MAADESSGKDKGNDMSANNEQTIGQEVHYVSY
jgi:hypothetical protein